LDRSYLVLCRRGRDGNQFDADKIDLHDRRTKLATTDDGEEE
jgi:hypothetical protein